MLGECCDISFRAIKDFGKGDDLSGKIGIYGDLTAIQGCLSCGEIDELANSGWFRHAHRLVAPFVQLHFVEVGRIS